MCVNVGFSAEFRGLEVENGQNVVKKVNISGV